MGSGISIELDEAPEIADAIAAVAGDDAALLALGEDIGEVDVIVSFGDGSSYTYTTDPLTASRVMNDPGSYNQLLRGQTSRSMKGRKSPLTRLFRK